MMHSLRITGYAAVLLISVSIIWCPAYSDTTEPLIVPPGSDAYKQILELLKKGSDGDARDGKGSKSLSWSEIYDNLDAKRLLKGHGPKPALIVAVIKGDERTVKRLLEKGVDVNATLADGSTALIWATRKSPTPIVKLILEYGADVNAKTNTTPMNPTTALMWSVWNCRGDVVKLLVDTGADVNAKSPDGWTALTWAARTNCPYLVKYFFRNGADTATMYSSLALMEAAELGYLETTQLLLDEGVDVNARSEDGWTALSRAASSGQLETVKLLLENDAEVDLEDNNGLTPLMKANRHAEVAKVLLAKGAVVNKTDKLGRSALRWAAYRGELAIVKMLIREGAYPNFRTLDKGETALSTASKKGHTAVARMLVAHGAKK